MNAVVFSQSAISHTMSNSQRVALLGAFLLASCAAASAPNLQRVTELIPGISTREDAVAKLGPPNSSSKIGDRTVIQWVDANSPHPVHLAIMFGMDGRMIQAVSDAERLDQLSPPGR